MLLIALEHLEKKIFTLLQIIPIVIGLIGLEKSEEELLTIISFLIQDCYVNSKQAAGCKVLHQYQPLLLGGPTPKVL